MSCRVSHGESGVVYFRDMRLVREESGMFEGSWKDFIREAVEDIPSHDNSPVSVPCLYEWGKEGNHGFLGYTQDASGWVTIYLCKSCVAQVRVKVCVC